MRKMRSYLASGLFLFLNSFISSIYIFWSSFLVGTRKIGFENIFLV
jgi:hypothetical protein